ncbi:MAG TPA: carboxymuconolactone decarboxylase family protein [Thermoleophilaceae bacterium]|nr:carboxymuconolactone decarboxylase family protein [Thermoleophilaceae bacterium]
MPHAEQPRIQPLAPSDWSEEMRPLATFAASGEDVSLGDLNIFRTLARHPALFQAWGPFGGYLLTNGTLSFEDRELLILRTGFNCRSPYEWGQHVRIALNGGMSRETVDRVAEGPGADGWSAREAALLRAADELHGSASISPDTWQALAGELDEQQLIELCVLVGQYHLVAFMLNAVGVQPEPGLEPLPPG